MDETLDDQIQAFLGASDDNAVYVKAESVELRVHLFGQMKDLIHTVGAETLVGELRKVESYIKYG